MKPEKESRKNHDFLTYLAIFVSLSALVVSITQTYYQHKNLYASAWPHLQITADREEHADTNKSMLTIAILNKGVGPAIIESVTYKYNGKEYKGVEDLVKKILGEHFSGSYKPIGYEDVISHDERVIHLSVSGAKNAQKLYDALVQVKMTIVYQSIYRERWEIVTDAQSGVFTKTTKLD